jgi:hypothetical protein
VDEIPRLDYISKEDIMSAVLGKKLSAKKAKRVLEQHVHWLIGNNPGADLT